MGGARYKTPEYTSGSRITGAMELRFEESFSFEFFLTLVDTFSFDLDSLVDLSFSLIRMYKYNLYVEESITLNELLNFIYDYFIFYFIE